MTGPKSEASGLMGKHLKEKEMVSGDEKTRKKKLWQRGREREYQ